MSKLVAKVSKINSLDNLNIVEFDFFGKTLKMMSLGLSSDIQIGTKVNLCVKPTSVAIAKNLSGEISLSNQLFATIENIENGELLSSILLKIEDCYLESIITKDSSSKMNLKKNDNVLVLIKASNLSIEEVLND
ncbi:TOBE domain-containing protein [Aliarcobacter butzleri]|uniref:TOBE domain-containing protein n=1 Tax=Aliarcobacter butzleri TaxID=28197 RepID=UPI001EDB32F9|nr:TOBE domain-containing protein [Aliarcobacter butzleri]MCG3676353.1 TOBE domain-containing protein [Aliarcobacter butzleri]